MPTSGADESTFYLSVIQPAIINLIKMLGFSARKAETVIAVRAVLLRLAHGAALPTDKAAYDRMNVSRRLFSQWMGRLTDSAGGCTLSGVVTNSS